MPRVSGYDHGTGRHCRSAALRNLSTFYGWGYDEPACFGFGAGLASTYAANPETGWKVWSGVAPWLERAFFERLEISHVEREGDEWDSAWDDVTEHLDADEPVLLFVDSAALHYTDADHDPPHAVVAVGYDDDGVVVSDGTVDDLQELSHAELRDAWAIDRTVSMQNRHLVVTRGRVRQDRRTAATRAVRETAEYMLHPLDAARTTRGPGEEGLSALRSFVDDLPGLADSDEAVERADDARRGISSHGVDAAFRGLYADAIEDLESWSHAGGDKGERMQDVARGWRQVGGLLGDACAADDPDERAATLSEAGSVLGDVADREEAFFEDVERETR